MCVAVVFCYVPTMAFADQDVPAVQEQSETFADSEETDQNAALSPQAVTRAALRPMRLTALRSANASTRRISSPRSGPAASVALHSQ